MILQLNGDKAMTCNLKIIKVKTKKIQMNVEQESQILKPHQKNANMHEYKVSGQGAVKISW